MGPFAVSRVTAFHLWCERPRYYLRALADCVQQNLLAIQVSYLIPDMVNVWETVVTELEISVKAFVAGTRDSQTSHDRLSRRIVRRTQELSEQAVADKKCEPSDDNQLVNS